MTQEELDRAAKKCGRDYAKRIGTYRGCEAWEFLTKDSGCVGYPHFALVKQDKIKHVAYGDKLHQKLWDLSNKNTDDDDTD